MSFTEDGEDAWALPNPNRATTPEEDHDSEPGEGD